MRLRGNVVLQYSLATLIVVALVSIILGLTMTKAITDYQLRSHIRLYPEIVGLAMRNPAELYRTLESGEPLTRDSETLLRDFLALGEIFRVKLWDSRATIIWSDERDLIGQRFADDDAFHVAMAGAVTYELGEAEKTENIDERNKGVTLQIYTPLRDGGKVVGVLEVYEANRDLFDQIAKNTFSIWLAVVAAGVVIYLLLFLIFYRSYQVQNRAKSQVLETQDVTIYALAFQAELRDLETGRHLDRTAIYVRILAEELGRLREYRSYFSREYVADLVKSAPLHDIGKVGVPDSILLKPGRLSDEEMEVMRKHCEYGARVLNNAQEKLKFRSFLTIAIQLTIGHHEKWNGTGYPQGLSGSSIPISARIMALADVYDALRSRRPYKEPFVHDACVEMIEAERGKHFDPAIVDAFMKAKAAFQKVSEDLAD